MTSNRILDETMSERSMTLTVSQPMLVRDAVMFVRATLRYAADITVEQEYSLQADGKSGLALLALNASPGDALRIIARGEDASQAIAALEAVYDTEVEGWLGVPRGA
ncbi:MAG: HPr family phosphocarrier protein [Verrucomicrobia bacterium]|jgi:phosphotransferase system HPr (HPr) family protein|nr:HPr family phosphocarrier protein [Verrucomicrobiota bacterium]